MPATMPLRSAPVLPLQRDAEYPCGGAPEWSLRGTTSWAGAPRLATVQSRRTPALVDILLAVVLSALSAATITGQGLGPGGWFGVALAMLAVAPVALRQVAPVLMLAVISLAMVAYVVLGYGVWPSNGLGILVAMLTVATLRSRAVAAGAFVAALAVLLIGIPGFEETTWVEVVQSGLVLLCAWALGDGTRRWALEAKDAASRAERAVAEERTRMARELHDVVTHHMSVVALQAGLAEYVIETDPAVARTAIGHAGAAGRDALLDLRRMLDALRSDDEQDAPYAPQPGLRQVDTLVGRLRHAGLEVDLRRSGQVRELPPGIELCAYRTVQESLTNVLKHAGPRSTALVQISYGEQMLTVEVRDDGVGPKSGKTAGYGLRGMRERAELYGGVLTVGPAPGGGFRVRLRVSATDLPTDDSSTLTASP